MSTGSPFFERTSTLNRKLQWGEWAGYHSAAAYADFHDIEYNAIRNTAALIDASPLYKYAITGPDATRLIDRVITRDAHKLQVGQVLYTPWCDERGKVIDDGTVARLDDTSYRLTAADPSYRWLNMNAHGLDVQVQDTSESLGALALQGPFARDVLAAASEQSWDDVGYFRRRAGSIAGVEIDVSRTGYTGDLGYELWVPADQALKVWDRLMEVGEDYALRPCGIRAMDVARVEAGLILIEVDYTSVRHAMTAEHEYSPGELGLGRLVNYDKDDFVGRRALVAERDAGGPPRRLVGLELAWSGIEEAFAEHDLPPSVSPIVIREEIPLFAGRRQVGRATSTSWSPTLKRMIALGSIEARFEPLGTELEISWTVEGRRTRVPATVVALPFLDLPRKRA